MMLSSVYQFCKCNMILAISSPMGLKMLECKYLPFSHIYNEVFLIATYTVHSVQIVIPCFLNLF